MTMESDQDDTITSNLALSQDLGEYEKMAKEAASAGQLLTAIEVARDGLARFGSSRKLRQQMALALAQTGALDGAREMLAELLKESVTDEETLCLQGRVYKEMWRHANDPREATDALQRSSRCYEDAFTLNEAYYPGINLAFTLAARGERYAAEKCAKTVAKLCRTQVKEAEGAPDGWLLGTLAEALTHRGEIQEAAEFYRQVAAAFAGRWRDLASMRRQAREILGFAGQPQDWLNQCFDFPTVAVFSGHMVDPVGRVPARFAAEREPEIREQISRHLKQVKAAYGYSSAACGGDILFCECLLEMDAKVNLVLPCPVNEFKRQSVSFGGPDWERRFHNVLGLSTTILIANPSEYSGANSDATSSMALIYANRIMTGMAVLQAQALDLDLKPITLWDGKPAVKAGGTGSVVEEWRRRQLNPFVISPGPAVVAGAPVPASGAEAPPTPKPPGLQQEIKAMLFAEVMNFKKIAEHQMPAFIAEFKGAVARLLASMPAGPAVSESWGRSNYFVYDGLGDAALFALELRDTVARTNWGQLGLPADLGIRAVLHAGPVYSYDDPVLKRRSCIGSHVNRAARVEPITPQGQIYVTQEFAALCGAEGVAAVGFEFLGRLPTAKLFEDAPLYRLGRGKKKTK
ncbi:MAG: DUF4071 domain-containing protein [Opitutus sp.]|nr:DUF4071 domain-containing protein [Opitutus sp.]